MSYYEKKAHNFMKLQREISETLTMFFDKAEEALQSGEGTDEALEFIGMKSDELLQKL